MNQTNWAINDSELRLGVYYHELTDALAIVTTDFIVVGTKKTYPLYGWRRIGDF